MRQAGLNTIKSEASSYKIVKLLKTVKWRSRLLSAAWSISLIMPISGIDARALAKPQNSTAIRIGWQKSWATQGQLVAILQKTNITKQVGLNPVWLAFNYGAPLNEAALAKEVDVVLTADQPIATLLSRSKDWKIVARLMYNRVSLYVPPKSDINSARGLRNQSIAVPFGAAAQRAAIQAVLKAGLEPGKNVAFYNLDMLEQLPLIQRSGTNARRWGAFSAMAGFDPIAASVQLNGLARQISEDKVVAVIAVNQRVYKNKTNLRKLLKSVITAWAYYRENQSQANQWFRTLSGLRFDDQVLKLSSSLEPNLKVNNNTELRIVLNTKDLRSLQQAADFLYDQKLVKKNLNMREWIDMKMAQEVQNEWSTNPSTKWVSP